MPLLAAGAAPPRIPPLAELRLDDAGAPAARAEAPPGAHSCGLICKVVSGTVVGGALVEFRALCSKRLVPRIGGRGGLGSRRRAELLRMCWSFHDSPLRCAAATSGPPRESNRIPAAITIRTPVEPAIDATWSPLRG